MILFINFYLIINLLLVQNLSLLQNYFSGEIKWHSMKEIHLSLSKTVVLAYHQIQPMHSHLKNLFTNFYHFKTYFSSKSLSFFINEEKTRSFLGFKVIYFLTKTFY